MLFMKLMLSSTQAWTHMHRRKITCIKSRLCLDINNIYHIDHASNNWRTLALKWEWCRRWIINICSLTAKKTSGFLYFHLAVDIVIGPGWDHVMYLFTSDWWPTRKQILRKYDVIVIFPNKLMRTPFSDPPGWGRGLWDADGCRGHTSVVLQHFFSCVWSSFRKENGLVGSL